MTRANILVITGTYGIKTNFQCNSSAYPSNVLQFMVKACASAYSTNLGATNNFYNDLDSTELAELIEKVGLTCGRVRGSYYYTLDFTNRKLTVCEDKRRWINAPVDYIKKGWQGCYENEKGKFGYEATVKGKKLLELSFIDLVDENGKPKQISILGNH